MGALQPGLPNPAVLPENWHLLIVDFKDCFFTIHLHPDDTPRFAFTLPSINKEAPAQRFEWTFVKAREAHSVFHQNAKGLQQQFNITKDEARGVVRTCPECSHHGPGLG
ncbi:POK6 protein, partial [Glaucidium brasilianum]|nr:POK6 protein [Glaucidium brasilianum]